MSNGNFNYPIFPDRIYTLTYEGFVYKVSGEDIANYFKHDAYLAQDVKESKDDRMD